MSDLTQSFIEMVEAYRAKPEFERKIHELSSDNAMCYQTIDLKNQQLTELKDAIAELTAKLAEVTKERDDASFRNLELEEKLGGIEKLLGLDERLEQARRDEHQATVNAMTPPEPVQVPMEPTIAENWPGASLVSAQATINNMGQCVMDPISTGQSMEKSAPEDVTDLPSVSVINPYTGYPILNPKGEYYDTPYYLKPSGVSWVDFVNNGGEAEPFMK